jgi:hypothetical protein
MQDYSTEQSRNTMRAAGPVGSNQTQGKGEIPGKVSVPMPGTNTTQPAYKGGMAKAPTGFNNGLINGMV